MNPFPPWDGPGRPLATSIRPDQFDVSYATARHELNGFCFGSDDGKVLLTDERGRPFRRPSVGSMSSEAVNGIAFFERWKAISTRSEVTLWTEPLKVGGNPLVSVCPAGSHGIIATDGGYFVAPMGKRGIMVAKPKLGMPNEFNLYDADDASLNFYQACFHRWYGGKEVLACAARAGGVCIGELPFWDRSSALNHVAFEGTDIIDVCFLKPESDSLALCALAKDGSMILFQDVLKDREPVTLKYEAIQGVGYRVLSCRGHVFLLTSNSLYVLAYLADRISRGVALNSFRTPILRIPLEAVDMNVCGNKWLLVVMPDEVYRVDLGLIDKNGPDSIIGGEMKEFPQALSFPKSKRSEVKRGKRPLAAAAV